MRFLKKLLLGLYIFLAAFAVICLVLWVIRGDEPDTLIMAVFGAAGVESVISGIMKIRESKEEKKTDPAETEAPRRAE